MDKVGSAEGEGATMGRTKDASGDRYKRRISGMQNSARDGADRPKDRKTNGSRDVKSMDHLLPSSSYSRQHERENGLRPVDSLRSRGVCPPPPSTRVSSPYATAKPSRANDGWRKWDRGSDVMGDRCHEGPVFTRFSECVDMQARKEVFL